MEQVRLDVLYLTFVRIIYIIPIIYIGFDK